MTAEAVSRATFVPVVVPAQRAAPTDAAPPLDHPRTLGWFGTSAMAMGGSNQSLFLLTALVMTQGSAAVPLLIVGLVLSYLAAPG